MSQDLYSVRLYWDGRKGCAKHNGVAVELRSTPLALPAVPHLREIDYAPEARVAQVRESADRWRDLSRDECLAVDAWLTRVSAAARVAIST